MMADKFDEERFDMEAHPRISLVIPIKDQAEYIRDLLDDVRSQTFDDFEVVFVDGDSKDGTVEIIREQAKTDSRISVLIYKKPGVSAARNFGIKRASGQYLVFPDGDDRLEPDYLMCLIKSITRGKNRISKGYERLPVQLGICGYDIFDEEGEIFFTPESVERVMDKDDMLCRLFYMGNYQGYVWNKIFRRDIIEKYGIRFDERCFYREDQLFLTEYISHIDSVRMDPARMYHYRMHDASAMGALRAEQKSARTRRRQRSNLRALIRMHGLLRGNPDARWLCRQSFYFEFKNLFF